MTSVVGRATRYQFQRTDGNTAITTDGGVLIPVADGTFFTEEMSMNYNIGNVFIQFFSGTAENPVPATPSAGTVTVEAGPYENLWLMPSETNSHIIQANTIISATTGSPNAVATYTPPSFNSQAKYSRIILNGVTGVTFMVADHWRSIS